MTKRIISVVLLLGMLALPNPAVAGVRAYYGSETKDQLVVEIEDPQNFSVSLVGNMDCPLWDLRNGKVFYGQIGDLGECRRVAAEEQIENVAAEITSARQSGLLVEGRIARRFIQLDAGDTVSIGAYQGQVFVLQFETKAGNDEFRFVSTPDESLGLVRDAARSLLLAEYELETRLYILGRIAMPAEYKAEAIETVAKFNSAFKTVFEAGAPLVWPKTNAQFRRIEDF